MDTFNDKLAQATALSTREILGAIAVVVGREGELLSYQFFG